MSPPDSPFFLPPAGETGLNLTFDIKGTDDQAGMRLQLVLREQALGEWPERTVIAWTAKA